MKTYVAPAAFDAVAIAPSADAFSAIEGSPAMIKPATDNFLDRPGGRIAYADEGSGPLVVMVPGLGDLKEEYRFLAPDLVEAGYRVVTMDIRGHGKSSVNWSDHTSAALGSDVVALVEHLGGETVAGLLRGNVQMIDGAGHYPHAEMPEATAPAILGFLAARTGA